MYIYTLEYYLKPNVKLEKNIFFYESKHNYDKTAVLVDRLSVMPFHLWISYSTKKKEDKNC